jgi:hypothetical protein
VPDWEDMKKMKYYIVYGYKEKELVTDSYSTYATQAFLPYYSSEKIAKLAIKHLEQEYKTILTK